MSPTDRQTLLVKLEYLRRTLADLQPYRAFSQEEFLGNPEKRLAVERLLQLAVESVMDCSRLFVAIEDLRRARDQREAYEILGEQGVLSKDLAKRLSGAKGFRNILVHEYIEIKPEEVYRNLQEGYGDLQEFAKALAAYLKEQGEKV